MTLLKTQIVTDSPLISVVIPTHNRCDALATTLLHLREQAFDHEWEVIVVNNLCTDRTDEIVGQFDFPVPLHLIHENSAGPAAARNAGAAASNSEYLVFVDNDIIVGPDFLQRHLEGLKSHPGSVILGQVACLPDQERTPFGRYRKALFPVVPPDSPVREVQGLSGQNCSIRRTDWERLGGFDEQFDLASVEDLDLAIRARDAGISVLLLPSITVLHNDWAGSSIEDYVQRQRTYSRAEPLLAAKHGARHPRPQLLTENLPPNWKSDPPSLVIRKLAKRFFASHWGRRLLLCICKTLERIWPQPIILHTTYRWLLAGAIYQGINEGMRAYADRVKSSTAGHARGQVWNSGGE